MLQPRKPMNLTPVVVVVSGFRREKKNNGFFSEVKCFALKIL